MRGNMMGYVVRSSQVVHATRNNMGSNVARDSIERVERYFYSFRNEVYLYRQEGFKGRMHCAVKRCQDFFESYAMESPKGSVLECFSVVYAQVGPSARKWNILKSTPKEC